MKVTSQPSPFMEEVLSKVLATQAFFGTLLYNLCDLRFCSGDDAPVPTAATTGQVIIINEDFASQFTLDQCVGLVLHEVMHIVLRHPDDALQYSKAGNGPDGKVFDAKKANIAMDLVMNALLIEAGIQIPPGGLVDAAAFPHDMDWEEAYRKLPKNPNKQPNGGEQGGEVGQGSHDKWSDEDLAGIEGMPDKVAAPTEAKLERSLKSAQIMGEQAGKVPGGMQRLVDKYTAPQVDWREVVVSTMVHTKGTGEHTWARPHRRRLVLPPNIYMPSATGCHAGIVGVYGDTSGSISDALWRYFFGEMCGIAEELAPEEMYIGSCDTEATVPLLVESADDVLAYTPEGGGGTDMPAVFRAFTEAGITPDVVVIITDGYTPWGEPPGYEVVWVMTTNVVAPYGKTVRIKV